MKSVTYGSEKARLQWRDMLDAALSGMKVIIERYSKPTVVMVSHETYEDLERRAALADSALEALRSDRVHGTWTSIEEIDEMRGPLNELRTLVRGEDEWNAIIEQAQRRAGVENLRDNRDLVYAELEKEMESLRQRQKVMG